MPANTAVFSILTLGECRDLPQAQLGRRVAKLLELYDHQLPIPYCNVLPISFLEQLFAENKLEVKFRWLFEHVNWQDQQSVNDTGLELQSMIKLIHWPAAAQATIFKFHQAWMTTEFVAVRPSFISDQARGRFSLLDIQGEANLTESILQLWANLYQPDFLSQRWREWQQGIHLPAAILIQKMIQSKASGFADLYIAQKTQQPQASIYGGWGITTQKQHQKQLLDEFVVNLKTGEVLSQTIQLKQLEYVHRLDQLDKKVVPYADQAVPCLLVPELKKLVELLRSVFLVIGKTHSEILEADWAFDGKNFFLLHILSTPAEQISATRPLKLPPNLPRLETPSHQLATSRSSQTDLARRASYPKLYLINSTSAPVPTDPFQRINGLCFASDGWWLSQPAHLKSLLEHGQAHALKHRLLQSLHTYFLHHETQELWYRPQALSSAQLRMLDQGKDYEEVETNSWLGYRGGLKMLHEINSFDFELDVLSDFAQETDSSIHLLLPWIRSSAELNLIYKHITHAPVEQYHHLKLWLECSTPENLLNIHQYAAVPIQGIVVNLDELHSLLFGLDPDNPNVLKYYSADFLLLHSLLKAVAKRLAVFHKPMILRTQHTNHQVLSLLGEIGEVGLMIPANELTNTIQALQTG